jgi:uncharacterized damage-inducible protein DinB
MFVSAAVLRTHLEYSAWASRLLVDCAGSIAPEELTHDFHTADRSILATLVHIFAADRIWLARIQETEPREFVTDADYSMAVLQHDWPTLHQRWSEWAGGITDNDAASLISYRDLKGRAWTQPLWQIVLHVVNHGTHHRGQVSGFLRALGHTPPAIDLVNYYRAQQQAAAG